MDDWHKFPLFTDSISISGFFMSFLPRFHSRGGGGGDSLMASGAIAQPHLVTQSSFAKSMFSSPTLSLALTNIDGLGAGEMIPADVRRRNREEEAAESRSGSENMVDGGSGEEVEGGGGGGRKKRKKRYHRHSAEQIQELEAMFKECPHPDEKQRLELSRRLSLETKQVKFWFQNRRTQMKTQLERHENTLLRQENEKLRAENMAIREAMRDPICSNCGGPAIIGEISIEEQQLRIENARLKDELDRVCALAGKFLGRAAVPVSPPLASSSCLEEYGGGGTMMMERCVYLEMGLAAMDEVVKMANEEEPLWVREKLNEEEYLRMFSGIKHINNGFVSEASRQTALVFLNTSALLDTLMDPDRWVDMFPNLVATASIADIISGGLGGTRNGALQLMHAELQILSPMVPVRQLSFLRFCKQHAEGVWAIVDVSIDPVTDTSSSPSCRRLPSGCLIHDMTNGYSKVTWVEHSEYDESYIHELYRPLIRSGLGFGAQRWIAALQRQSECLAILSTPLDHSGISANGRRNMVKLAQRMTANFCAGVCASTVYKWNKLNTRNNNVGEDVKVMTRKSVEDPGEPPGTVLSAATSVWVAAAVERVFEFLRDERLRSEWDILSNGGPMQEMLRIPKSQHRHHPNAVSLLRATSLNPNQSSMLILQETCTDASGSLVVYAPVDIPAMQAVMNGGDSAYVALLPSGFAVVPAEEDGGGGRGSLLTVAFQILVNSLPTDKLTVESVETVNNLISCTVQKIRNALRCHEPST